MFACVHACLCPGGVPACVYEYTCLFLFFVIFVLLSFDLNVSVPFHLNVFLCWEGWGVGSYTLLYQYLYVWMFSFAGKKRGGMFKYAFCPYLCFAWKF